MKYEILGEDFYFDRVTINSILEVEELRDSFNIEELSGHCAKIKNKEAEDKGRRCGYKSRIDALDVTDGFFEELSKPDLIKQLLFCKFVPLLSLNPTVNFRSSTAG